MNKIKRVILNLAIKYIVRYSKDSNVVNHALQEFEYYGDNDEYFNMMKEDLIPILSLISTQGDSGYSIQAKKHLLSKCIDFKPLSKLTLNDIEFNKSEFGSIQNKRCGAVFKDIVNGKEQFKYIDAVSFYQKYYLSKDTDLRERSSGAFSTGIMRVFLNNGDIKQFKTGIIKNKDKFDLQSFSLPVYEIENPKDWWNSFVTENDLKAYQKHYKTDFEDFDLSKEDDLTKELIYKCQDHYLKNI